MKIEKLLEHQSLILPKNWKSLGYSSYYECVVKEGSVFLKLLTELDDSEKYDKDKYLGELSKEHLIAAASGFFQVVV